MLENASVAEPSPSQHCSLAALDRGPQVHVAGETAQPPAHPGLTRLALEQSGAWPTRPRCASLLEAVLTQANRAAPGLCWRKDRTQAEQVDTALLADTALRLASVFAEAGIAVGARVILLLPTSRGHAQTFLALLALGAIPCTIAEPSAFGNRGDRWRHLQAVMTRFGASAIVSTRELLAELVTYAPQTNLLDVELALQAAVCANPHPLFAVDPQAIAFIQCTSGSTGVPKGVAVSHANLVNNLQAMGDSLRLTREDVLVGWLPLYHDMGLVGCLCLPLYWGIRAVLLTPQAFLRRPASWLTTIAKQRGTISPAPNFAYAYALDKICNSELNGADLSCWRAALCGAEPVHAGTLTRFRQRFAAFGFSPRAFMPCYGLAEATLAVSFHGPNQELTVDYVSREALARGEVVDVAPDLEDAQAVVSCGHAIGDTQLQILDENGQKLNENLVGEIVVKSASVTREYYDETAGPAPEQGFRTGDLGYLRDGALRVTGRNKDLIIIRGKNYAPSEFEWAAEAVSGVVTGRVIAFGVFDAASGTEKLHLVCEVEHAELLSSASLKESIRVHVARITSILADVVLLVARGTVPRTTSGKLQRSKLKSEYLKSSLCRGKNPSEPPVP